MPKHIEEIPLVAIKLNTELKIPMYKQLYEQIRLAILQKKFKGGKKLPGTRTLALSLGLSRNTVNLAYEQLMIEGYIKGETGSGTFVTKNIPEKLFIPTSISSPQNKVQSRKAAANKMNPEVMIFSKKNFLIEEVKPFRNGIPALSDFPFNIWMKITNRVLRNLTPSYLGYSDTAGFKPLRIAITDYLRTYRAINCTYEQILIVNGSQQGLDLIGRVLLNNKSKVWIEDPGYPGARVSFISAGAKVYPVPLNDDGLNLVFAVKNYPVPQLVYTTPSHQYPLGCTMPISARLKLLEWARENGVWIIEDDYDSEYRYSGNPLQSLQGLDSSGSVIYLGTFSKVLFPGLRLGYVVLPSIDLTDRFIAAKSIIDRQNSIIDQIAVTIFIEEGHFTKHLRRMRVLYKERQEFFISEIKKEIGPLITIKSDNAGMHLTGWLKNGYDDKAVSEKLLSGNIFANPLSDYTFKFKMPPALILGYTAFNEKAIRAGVQRMAKILIEE